MNKNDKKLMAMLDWNNSEDQQQKGRDVGKSVQNLQMFLQPLFPKYNKNVWDNCAKILYEKSDEELEPYLIPLLEWLQDLNWPGALLIMKRLSLYSKQTALTNAFNICAEKARRTNDSIWLENITGIQNNQEL